MILWTLNLGPLQLPLMWRIRLNLVVMCGVNGSCWKGLCLQSPVAVLVQRISGSYRVWPSLRRRQSMVGFVTGYAVA